ELYAQTAELGMQALVETHTAEELERALALEADLIGVNARNLKTLDVDLTRAADLLREIPSGPLAIGESAVASVTDVEAYSAVGADAVLVGEALVTAGDPARTVADYRPPPRCRSSPPDRWRSGRPRPARAPPSRPIPRSAPTPCGSAKRS